MRNILFLLLIGLVVYAVISLLQRARSGPAGQPGPARPPRGPRLPPKRTEPIAPDDDPEFLWLLEQQQKQADREARRAEAEDDGTDPDNPGPRDATP